MADDILSYIDKLQRYSDRIAAMKKKHAAMTRDADAAYEAQTDADAAARKAANGAIAETDKKIKKAEEDIHTAVRDAYRQKALSVLGGRLESLSVDPGFKGSGKSCDEAEKRLAKLLETKKRIAGVDIPKLATAEAAHKAEYDAATADIKKKNKAELDALTAEVRDDYFAHSRLCVTDYTLDDEVPQKSDSVPESIVVGNLRVPAPTELAKLFSTERLRLPAVLDMRGSGNILIELDSRDDAYDGAVENAVVGLAMHYLESFPCGDMYVGVYSSALSAQKKLGAFFSACSGGGMTVHPKAISSVQEFAAFLGSVRDRANDINDKLLANGCEDIYELYEKGIRVPFQLIVLADVIGDMNDEHMRELYGCVYGFAKCGVRLIIADDPHPSATGRQGGGNTFLGNVARLVDMCTIFKYERDGGSGTFTDADGHETELIHVDEKVGQQYVYDFCKQYCAGVGKKKDYVTYEDIGFGKEAPDPNDWDAISIPIGIDKPDIWRIDFSCQHNPPIANLVIGVPGTGKSTLIDSMILNGAIKYSPDELIFYLLDFKDGVSSSAYTRDECKIPHVKVVSQENKPEEAGIILSNILKESKQRNAKFKQLSRESGKQIRSIAEYNELVCSLGGGRRKMPRLVIVIDECQYLFDDDALAKQCEDIVRKCRSQGIHLVLATQTLSNSMRKTIKFVDGRYCFEIVENDATELLAHKYAQSVRTEVPKGSYMAFASNNSGQDCRRIKIAHDDMPRYAQMIREKWSEYPTDVVEVGDKTPLRLTPVEFEAQYASAMPQDAFTVPLGEDYTDHSAVTAGVEEDGRSAAVFIGSDREIASGLCGAVLLAAKHYGAKAYAADASRDQSLAALAASGAAGDAEVTDEKGYLAMLAEVNSLFEKRSENVRAEHAPVAFVVNAAQNIEAFLSDEKYTLPSSLAEIPLNDDEDMFANYGAIRRNRDARENAAGVSGKTTLLHLLNNAYKVNIFICFAMDSLGATGPNGDSVLSYQQKTILRGAEFKVLFGRPSDDWKSVMDDSFKDAMVRELDANLAFMSEHGHNYCKFRPVRIKI